MEGKMENSFIDQLRDIRSNFGDAVRATSKLEHKLTGPSPSEGNLGNQKGPESVASLIAEVNGLTMQLVKMLGHQHEIVGDFQPTQDVSSRTAYA
jgi:hypothetical protein